MNDNQQDLRGELDEDPPSFERRQTLQRLGRYAYVPPALTTLLITHKAHAQSNHVGIEARPNDVPAR